MENELAKKKVEMFSAKDKAYLNLGLGLCFLSLAWVDWNNAKPPTGKWAWASRWAIDIFGPNGTSWLYILIAAALLLVALRNLQIHRRNKPS